MKERIQVVSSKKSLTVIRTFVKDRLLSLDITGTLSNQIVLAIDEACANCIIHQHKCDGSAKIEVYLYKKGTKLFVEIKDTGEAYPIHKYEPEEIQDLIKKRKQGGLGLALIHRIMDQIAIEQHPSYYIYKFTKRINN